MFSIQPSNNNKVSVIIVAHLNCWTFKTFPTLFCDVHLLSFEKNSMWLTRSFNFSLPPPTPLKFFFEHLKNKMYVRFQEIRIRFTSKDKCRRVTAEIFQNVCKNFEQSLYYTHTEPHTHTYEIFYIYLLHVIYFIN